MITQIRQAKTNDCVRAAVASILGLQLTDVPEMDPETWPEQLGPWLELKGFTFTNMRFPAEACGQPRGWSIGCVPAGDAFPAHWGHSVVCYNGLVMWDPQTGKVGGCERPDEFTILYPVNVSEWMKGAGMCR